MRSTLAPRVLGGLTAAYGAYTLVRPQSLVRVTGLAPAGQPESSFIGNVARAIGALPTARRRQ